VVVHCWTLLGETVNFKLQASLNLPLVIIDPYAKRQLTILSHQDSHLFTELAFKRLEDLLETKPPAGASAPEADALSALVLIGVGIGYLENPPLHGGFSWYNSNHDPSNQPHGEN